MTTTIQHLNALRNYVHGSAQGRRVDVIATRLQAIDQHLYDNHRRIKPQFWPKDFDYYRKIAEKMVNE